jgi:high affinity sulfate transporter 1
VPGIEQARRYRREWLWSDISAGLVLTSVLVPVGMAYAAVAGLPPITGLYATMVALLTYALFGTSRVLVLGPDSALAAIIAATILPLAAGNNDRLVALAGALALLSGLICIAVGLARFGFITDLISKPIRLGYLNGIALTVIVSQAPKLLGFSSNGNNLAEETVNLVRAVGEGQTNPAALAIGAASLVTVLLVRRYWRRLPGVLFAVVGATLTAALFNLPERAGIEVVGALPRGLPTFTLPMVSLADLRALLSGALAIALVAFADTSVLSRTFALRGGYSVDQNQELVALGAANIAAGLFQGIPVSSSSSRTPVAESAGAKTQLTGVVGALSIALLLVFAPNLLQSLPQSALGAVVIASCIALVDVRSFARLYRMRRSEFALALTAFLGVAFIGVIEGVFLAVALALAAFVWRAWRPYDAVLGRVKGLRGYHDISRYPQARLVPGLVLFRWDAPLFFANAETFREHVLQAVANAPTPTRRVVVAAEPVTDIDITASDALIMLHSDLTAAGIELYFAEMKDPVKDELIAYGIFDAFGDGHFYPTVGHAVDDYVKEFVDDWKG